MRIASQAGSHLWQRICTNDVGQAPVLEVPLPSGSLGVGSRLKLVLAQQLERCTQAMTCGSRKSNNVQLRRTGLRDIKATSALSHITSVCCEPERANEIVCLARKSYGRDLGQHDVDWSRALPAAETSLTSRRWKNFLVCLAVASSESGGGPIISTTRVSRSCSEAPGNRGSPRNSSAATQPSDHMSMATLYGYPSRTCRRPGEVAEAGSELHEMVQTAQALAATP